MLIQSTFLCQRFFPLIHIILFSLLSPQSYATHAPHDLQSRFFERELQKTEDFNYGDTPEGLFFKGIHLLEQGELKNAGDFLRESKILFQKNSKTHDVKKSEIYLAFLKMSQERNQNLIIKLKELERFFSDAEDFLFLGETQFYLGKLLKLEGRRNEEAQKSLQNSTESYKKSNFPWLSAKSWIERGEISIEQSMWQEAGEYFLKAREKARSPEMLARSLAALGNLALNTYRFSSARHHLENSLKISKSSPNALSYALGTLGMGDLLFFKGNQENALTKYQQALAIFKHREDVVGECMTRLKLGEAYRMSDFVEEAEQEFEKALKISKNLQSPYLKGMAYLGLADVYRITSHSTVSLEYYDSALNNLEKSATLREIGRTLRGQASLFHALGNYEKAKKTLEKALKISTQTGDHRTASKAYIWKGKRAFSLGHYSQAREFYEQGLLLCRKIENLWNEAQLLTYLGDLEFERSNFLDALNVYKQSINVSKKINDRAKLGLSYLGIAKIKREEAQKPRKLLDKALKLFREINLSYGEALALLEKGKISSDKGVFPSAEQYYQEAMKIAQTSQEKELEAKVWAENSYLELKKGNRREAEIAHQESLRIFELTKNLKLKGFVLLTFGEKIFQDNQQAGIQKIEEALQAFKEIDNPLYAAHAHLSLGGKYLKIGKVEEASRQLKMASDLYGFLNHGDGMQQSRNLMQKVKNPS